MKHKWLLFVFAIAAIRFASFATDTLKKSVDGLSSGAKAHKLNTLALFFCCLAVLTGCATPRRAAFAQSLKEAGSHLFAQPETYVFKDEYGHKIGSVERQH